MQCNPVTGRRLSGVWAFCVLASVALSACGGGGGSSDGDPSPEPSAKRATAFSVVDVDMRDHDNIAADYGVSGNGLAVGTVSTP